MIKYDEEYNRTIAYYKGLEEGKQFNKCTYPYKLNGQWYLIPEHMKETFPKLFNTIVEYEKYKMPDNFDTPFVYDKKNPANCFTLNLGGRANGKTMRESQSYKDIARQTLDEMLNKDLITPEEHSVRINNYKQYSDSFFNGDPIHGMKVTSHFRTLKDHEKMKKEQKHVPSDHNGIYPRRPKIDFSTMTPLELGEYINLYPDHMQIKLLNKYLPLSTKNGRKVLRR